MSDIVPPTNVLTIAVKREADPHLVEFLSNLLDRAKVGEFNFVLAVATTHDGVVIDGYTRCEAIRPYLVLGALAAMQNKFGKQAIIDW